MFGTLRKMWPTLAVAMTLTLIASAVVVAGDDGFKDLFNGKDLTGWKTVGGKDDTFTVKEGVIVVSGKPNGYFHSDKSYKNYVLKFDWKFIKDGNSGLLVHITGGHKVWPKSVEVQGMQKDHGNIFAIGGAKGSFKTDKAAQKEAIKVGDWNTTEVTVKNGEITSKINGKQVSTGKISTEPKETVTEGPFGLQSEGVELHFKNIKIKVLD